MSEAINRVGQIRTSQLLWNYGPGALIDLPNFSAITMGLDLDIALEVDGWDLNHCIEIHEPRLLNSVRRRLGTQIESLRMPPMKADGGWQKDKKELPVGIPVEPFPRWFRCTACNRLAPYGDPQLEVHVNWQRPELTKVVHAKCPRSNRASDAIPARLVLACKNGHLDDFPWHWFCHQGQSSCDGDLQLFEVGSAIETNNLMVYCPTCDTKRSLSQALMGNHKKFLPACRGRHAHLGTYESCKESPRVLSLGASNIWFPVNLSALDIPIPDDLPDAPKSLFEIKWPEWEVLTDDTQRNHSPQFRGVEANPPSDYAHLINQVVVVERLREVNALIGFTRVESPDEAVVIDEHTHLVKMTRQKPTWVPAGEVHGEGMFIRFNETQIQDWEHRVAVQRRFAALSQGHRAWRAARNLAPGAGLVDIRYVLLHTFSHLLIRELALECGYSAASIKERIYANADEQEPMAGVLLYTAANDTDGTLGGLIEIGHSQEDLNRLINQALYRARVCSSDPLCAEHQPEGDSSVHLAACHACTFLAETSCERGNKYLDRAMLIPTASEMMCAFMAE